MLYDEEVGSKQTLSQWCSLCEQDSKGGSLKHEKYSNQDLVYHFFPPTWCRCNLKDKQEGTKTHAVTEGSYPL